MTCAVLIVAAGRGHRFGGTAPKQYAALKGEPMLRRTLQAFLRHPALGPIAVAIHPDDRALFAGVAEGFPQVFPVAGGPTRQESARLGLEALATRTPASVLIHDGARPCVSRELIDRVLVALASAEAVVPTLPVVDTLKRVSGGSIVSTVPRDDLVRVQTPQGFNYASILAAHRAHAGEALTDDAAVMERAGRPVTFVNGEDANIKVTTMDDLEKANASLAETRTGSGFDVHRFGPGDGVMLCGVKVAHSHGLVGHSDADVALHAATDAILGAIGAGDIGQHFPPSDPQWRGAASHLFLSHAHGLLRARGGSLVHLDITIICERPKIGPHRSDMIAELSKILGLQPDRLSVKATTTEGLGFTGRAEGIAAQALATVRI